MSKVVIKLNAQQFLTHLKITYVQEKYILYLKVQSSVITTNI